MGIFFFASALQIFNIGALHCSESFGENKTKLICNYAKWKTTKTKAAVQKLANVKKRCLTFLVVSNYYNQSSGVEGAFPSFMLVIHFMSVLVGHCSVNKEDRAKLRT